MDCAEIRCQINLLQIIKIFFCFLLVFGLDQMEWKIHTRQYITKKGLKSFKTIWIETQMKIFFKNGWCIGFFLVMWTITKTLLINCFFLPFFWIKKVFSFTPISLDFLNQTSYRWWSFVNVAWIQFEFSEFIYRRNTSISTNSYIFSFLLSKWNWLQNIHGISLAFVRAEYKQNYSINTALLHFTTEIKGKNTSFDEVLLPSIIFYFPAFSYIIIHIKMLLCCSSIVAKNERK